MKVLFIISLMLYLPSGLLSQDLSGLRERLVTADSDTIKLDSLRVVPGTIRLVLPDGELLSDSLFSFDYNYSVLVLRPETNFSGEEIRIQYRVFTADPTLEVSRKDTSLIIPAGNREPEYADRYTYNPVSDRIWKEESLVRSGSISRGISFGNTQDVIVNSNLNLQLSGKLDDNINIIASISDQNIPLQPEGYSQQINEFDKIYIRLFNEQMSLTAGDFEVKGGMGRFLPLEKKAQGIQFSAILEPENSPFKTISNTTSAAISKGNYHRHSFTGLEGNQGPYRLMGANKELFIVILAGSERVFIDGRLLTRGIDNDYTIDYNLAEITFTSGMPITKDRRILVEFEYSDRNYARFMLTNTTALTTEKTNYFINIFSGHDARNQPLRQDLSENEKEALASIGDSLHRAWVPRVDSMEFRNDIVLYARTDTIADGRVFSVYRYSVDPLQAHFRPGFSYVGERQGNYIPQSNSANGRVFRWVAPVNGVPSGSHEPVTLLVTPKKQQVISLGGNTLLSEKTDAYFELAVSNYDKNTFSELDNENNKGIAFRLGIDNRIPLGIKGRSLGGGVDYEFSGKQFTTTERYNPVEHERDWNLENNGEIENEQRLSWYGIYDMNSGDFVRYKGELLRLSDNYSGLRNTLESSANIVGLDSRLNISYMNSESDKYNTGFLKHFADVSKSFRVLRLGLRVDGENNLIREPGHALLSQSSFAFNQWEVYLRNPDTSAFHIFTSYREREDKLPVLNQLEPSSFAREISAGFRSKTSRGNNLAGTVHHRRLDAGALPGRDMKPENSLNGRLEARYRFFNGILQNSWFYETGSGMELKKDFMYLEVARGQGTYVWTDYNENGIKEIDEFEPAAFPDQADYIRILIPGDDFIRTRSNQFSQSIRLTPPARWQLEPGIKKFISRFSNQGAFQTGQKTRHSHLVAGLNPFHSSVSDTNLISLSTSFRNTLTLQPVNRRFTVEYLHQTNKSKNLLVNGSEIRQMQSDALHSRFEASSAVIFSNTIAIGSKSHQSEFFPGRNHNIDSYSGGLDVAFQPGFSLQTSLHFNLKRQENKPGKELAEHRNIGTAFNYTIPSKGNITLRADYFYIKFSAPVNTPLAWEMLEGLKPGNNMTFTVQAQQNLTGSLQMSLNYNGRTSQGNRFIHTGGMQLRAFF